jgi:hypothetical protein
LLKNAPIPARTLQASTPRLPPPKACAPRRGGYGVNHARPTC